MHGQNSSDVEVGASIDEVWQIYGTAKIAKVANDLLPAGIIEKVEFVGGDGEVGVGTLKKATCPPGGYFAYAIEKYTTLDHEKHLKVSEVIEGGPLKLGFSLFRLRIEAIEKDANSTIIRSTIEYEIDEEFAANASFATTAPLDALANAVGQYLSEKKTN